MKTVKNKTVQVKIGGTEIREKKYSELIVECVNNPPQEGFTVKDMQQRMKILEIAEKAKSEMQFEDSDYSKLRDCVIAMRWKFLSKDIIEFCETIILQKNGKE